MNNTTAVNVTLPASLASNGQNVTVIRGNAGVTFSGSNILSNGGTAGAPYLRARYSVASAIYLGAGIGWLVTGDIS